MKRVFFRRRRRAIASREGASLEQPVPAESGGSGPLASASGRWLLVIICLEAGVALSIRLPLLYGQPPWVAFDGPVGIPALLALLLVPVAVHAAWRLVRQHRRERAQASRTAGLMDTVLSAGHEWLWAIGGDGRFTFSSPASSELVGYESFELVGKHCSLVINLDELAAARKAGTTSGGADAKWAGLVTGCRHRNGGRVLVEVSGRPVRDRAGRVCGFEGTSRALDAGAASTLAAEEVRERVEAMLAGRTLLTAFQPVRSLETGAIVGAEALTRFLSSPGISPEAWFVEAESVGLGVDLEILAVQTALAAAAWLPSHLYVAVNLSPRACLDPWLVGLLEESNVPAWRIVLELTERHEVADYEQLAVVLGPLRHAGLRIAVDDAGAGFASICHILELNPDLIKLDRKIIAGIDTDPAKRAFGAAMVGFATEIGAGLVAEGIETGAELTAVTELGMAAGQGYLLGRPSVRPEEWATWRKVPPREGWPESPTKQRAGD
ncbi:EAL domain-containing protein [Micrococcaceae bacterium Sec5.7]